MGQNPVKSAGKCVMVLLAIDFFNGKSCWGLLQSRSLGTPLVPFYEANPNSISKLAKEATKEKSINILFLNIDAEILSNTFLQIQSSNISIKLKFGYIRTW